MPTALKILLIAFAVVAGAILSVLLAGIVILDTHTSPSRFIDFAPQSFQEDADEPFFYAVGDNLKHGRRIEPDARTLFHGAIRFAVPSPDNQMAAVVADGQLYVAHLSGKPPALVTAVEPVLRSNPPYGKSFFRDNGFQWSRDSRYLYLIKDEYYEPDRPSLMLEGHLYSDKAELWRYGLETGALERVIAPFRAAEFFLGLDGWIYFSELDPDVGFVLKSFDGSQTKLLQAKENGAIDISELRPDRIEQPFFTFDVLLHAMAVSNDLGLQASYDDDGNRVLLLNEKTILAIAVGQDLKGPAVGLRHAATAFLPGNRQFLIHLETDVYRGQLLVDTATGAYKTLPENTHVFPITNTLTYPVYCVTRHGLGVRARQQSCQ